MNLLALRKCLNCRCYCVGILCFDCVRAVAVGVAVAWLTHHFILK